MTGLDWYGQDMDHQIEWIAARQLELQQAATTELIGAICFITGSCLLLAIVLWWWDPY